MNPVPGDAPPAGPISWGRAAVRLRILQLVQMSAVCLMAAAAIGAAVVVVGELGRLTAQRDRADDAVARVQHLRNGLMDVQVGYFRAVALHPLRKGLTPGRMRDVQLAAHDMAALLEDQRGWVPPEVNRRGRLTQDAMMQVLLLVVRNVRTRAGSPAQHRAQRQLGVLSRRLSRRADDWVGALEAQRAHEGMHEAALRTRLLTRLGWAGGLLGVLALALWVLLDRARGRVVGALRWVSEEQQAGAEITTAVARGTTVQEVVDLAARHALAIPGVGSVAVYAARPSGAPGRMAALGPAGGRPDLAAGEVLAGAAAVVRPVEAGGRRDGDEPPPGGGACLAVPVVVEGCCWGAVAVVVQDAGRARQVHPRLERLAATLGMAIAGVEARARLTDQATTDPLTGLANHRAFQERMRHELAAAEDGGPLALVLMDIDHFKTVNDGLGHQAGDQVLVEVARRLGDLARGGDMVARVGGEEFAWLMPATDAAGAHDAAERARLAMRSTGMGRVPLVTVSAGVACTGDAGEATDLMTRADAALYWAKEHGRDQTRRWTADVTKDASSLDHEARVAHLKALAAIQALARAVDARDPYTFRHSERVAELTHRLALAAGWRPETAADLREAALMHDVGKVGVPDAVLLKPMTLTAAEFAQVQVHAALGAQIVSGVLSPRQVAWVRGHHEHWSGRGYPDGLAGRDIPEGARLMAVADMWDALTSDRPYRPGRDPEEALAVCRAERGMQLCPDAVDVLVRLWQAGEVPMFEDARKAETFAR
ncbi:MAG: diguanylate cyclase [Thermoleophilia bacterium]